MIAQKRTLPGPIDELAREKSQKSGTWRTPVVIEQLNADFHGKCYLCEQKQPTSANVEHLVPHRNIDRDLMFDWNNLFLACSHCNGTKGDRFFPILNCTAPGIAVLKHIDFEFVPFPHRQIKIQALTEDKETVTTCRLLEAVYNGSDTAIVRRLEAANIRKQVFDDFQKFMAVFERYKNETDKMKKDIVADELRRALQPDTPFTAIKACFVRRQPQCSAVFADTVDVL